METVIHRHKTLGTWVPTWVGGPCRNEECPAYAEPEGSERAHRAPNAREDARAARPGTGRERASGSA